MALPVYKRISDKKHIAMLAYLCGLVYFTSYVTRINYKAVTSAVMETDNLPMTLASLPSRALRNTPSPLPIRQAANSASSPALPKTPSPSITSAPARATPGR